VTRALGAPYLKKFMPAANATTYARPTIRWPLKSSPGIIGYGANLHSHITQAAIKAMPKSKVHKIYALLQAWVYPPELRATRLLEVSNRNIVQAIYN
jgi:hypothetical protein